MSKLREAAAAVVKWFDYCESMTFDDVESNTAAYEEWVARVTALRAALDEPDPTPVVKAAVAISQECCHYSYEHTCYLENILDDDETASTPGDVVRIDVESRDGYGLGEALSDMGWKKGDVLYLVRVKEKP